MHTSLIIFLLIYHWQMPDLVICYQTNMFCLYATTQPKFTTVSLPLGNLPKQKENKWTLILLSRTVCMTNHVRNTTSRHQCSHSAHDSTTQGKAGTGRHCVYDCACVWTCWRMCKCVPTTLLQTWVDIMSSLFYHKSLCNFFSKFDIIVMTKMLRFIYHC